MSKTKTKKSENTEYIIIFGIDSPVNKCLASIYQSLYKVEYPNKSIHIALDENLDNADKINLFMKQTVHILGDSKNIKFISLYIDHSPEGGQQSTFDKLDTSKYSIDFSLFND